MAGPRGLRWSPGSSLAFTRVSDVDTARLHLLTSPAGTRALARRCAEKGPPLQQAQVLLWLPQPDRSSWWRNSEMGTLSSPGAQGRGPSLAPHLHMGVCFWGIGAQMATMGSCPQPHSGWVKGTLGIGVTAGRSHRMGGTSLVGWTESKCLKSWDRPQSRQIPSRYSDSWRGGAGKASQRPAQRGSEGLLWTFRFSESSGFGPVSA